VWYAVGNGWGKIEGISYPQYDINYVESTDGFSFGPGIKAIKNDPINREYRIGRPRVYRSNDRYIMNFTYGTTDGRYLAGQAISDDGIKWTRKDSEIGISTSVNGWDSKHISYPCILKVNSGKTYMFYNGNHMGKYGFGYAELVNE